MNLRLLGAVCAIQFTLVSLSANAAFIGRLETSPGSGVFQAYYDDQLDVTWAADANINGQDTWGNQIAWVAGLTIGGVGGWRLPNMNVNGDGLVFDCASANKAACLDNEYGHLWIYGAGTIFDGGIVQGPGPFSNIQYGGGYWSSTEIPTDPTVALLFDLSAGINGALPKNDFDLFSWAVRSGDVSAVPVPAAVWLFGSGLLGLIGIANRKKV